MPDDFENYLYQCFERWMAQRYTERHGLVTSYDPQNYLAKVALQPEGQETGWLPIETGHIGEGYGNAVGLTPGDGVSTGDQVIVRFQEGDIESGKIVQRVHSDKDKPPTVSSGEMVFWTKFSSGGSGGSGGSGAGQQIFFRKDGALIFQDGSGAQIVLSGGNITTSGKNLTTSASQNFVVSATDFTISASGTGNVTAAGQLAVNGDPLVVNGGGSSTPPFTVPG